MAAIWVDTKCPACGEEVEDKGVLVALVSLTKTYSYASCGVHTFQHLKHTAVKGVSIHHTGGCPSFKLSQPAKATLGSFIEFLED